jgi:hypothetical protein
MKRLILILSVFLFPFIANAQFSSQFLLNCDFEDFVNVGGDQYQGKVTNMVDFLGLGYTGNGIAKGQHFLDGRGNEYVIDTVISANPFNVTLRASELKVTNNLEPFGRGQIYLKLGVGSDGYAIRGPTTTDGLSQPNAARIQMNNWINMYRRTRSLAQWDQYHTYEAGDVVFYDGSVYTASADPLGRPDTASTWTATTWSSGVGSQHAKQSVDYFHYSNDTLYISLSDTAETVSVKLPVQNADSIVSAEMFQDSILRIVTSDGLTFQDTVRSKSTVTYFAVNGTDLEISVDQGDTLIVDLSSLVGAISSNPPIIGQSGQITQFRYFWKDTDDSTRLYAPAGTTFKQLAYYDDITALLDSVASHLVRLDNLDDSIFVFRALIDANSADIATLQDSMSVHTDQVWANKDSIRIHRIAINRNDSTIEANEDTMLIHSMQLLWLDSILESVNDSVTILNDLIYSLPPGDSIEQAEIFNDSILLISTTDGNVFQDTIRWYTNTIFTTFRDSVNNNLNVAKGLVVPGDSITSAQIFEDSILLIQTYDGLTFRDTVRLPGFDDQPLLDSVFTLSGLISANTSMINSIRDSVQILQVLIDNIDVTNSDSIVSAEILQDSILKIVTADGNTFQDTVRVPSDVTYFAIRGFFLDIAVDHGDTLSVDLTALIGNVEGSAPIKVQSLPITDLRYFWKDSDDSTRLYAPYNTTFEQLAYYMDILELTDSVDDHRLEITTLYSLINGIDVIGSDSITSAEILNDSILRIVTYDGLTFQDTIRVSDYDDSGLRDSINAHRGELTELFDSLGVHRTELSGLLDSVNAHRVLIYANSDSITQHRMELNGLLDSILAHRTELSALTDSIGAHRIEITALTDSNSVQRSLIYANQDSIAKILAQLPVVADSITSAEIFQDSILRIVTVDGNTFQDTIRIPSEITHFAINGTNLEIEVDNDGISFVDLSSIAASADSLPPIIVQSLAPMNYRYFWKDSDDSTRVQAPYGTGTFRKLAYLSDVTALLDSVASHLLRIESLETDVATNTSDISTNSGDISTNTSSINSNRSDINDNISDISDLQDSTTSQRGDINQNISDIASLQDSTTDQRLDISQNMDSIDAVVAIINAIVADSITNAEIAEDSILLITTADGLTFRDTIRPQGFNSQPLYDSLAVHLGLIVANQDSVNNLRTDLKTLDDYVASLPLNNSDSITIAEIREDSILRIRTIDNRVFLDTIRFTWVKDSLSDHFSLIAELFDTTVNIRSDLNALDVLVNALPVNNADSITSFTITEDSVFTITTVDGLTFKDTLGYGTIHAQIASLIAQDVVLGDSNLAQRIDINSALSRGPADSLILAEISEDSILVIQTTDGNTYRDTIRYPNSKVTHAAVNGTNLEVSVDGTDTATVDLTALIGSIEGSAPITAQSGQISNFRYFWKDTDDSTRIYAPYNTTFEQLAYFLDILEDRDSLGDHRTDINLLFSLVNEIDEHNADSLVTAEIFQDSILRITTIDGLTFQDTIRFGQVTTNRDSVQIAYAEAVVGKDSIVSAEIFQDTILRIVTFDGLTFQDTVRIPGFDDSAIRDSLAAHMALLHVHDSLIGELQVDVGLAQLDIAQNQTDISTNEGDILTNSGNITTNQGNIASNTAKLNLLRRDTVVTTDANYTLNATKLNTYRDVEIIVNLNVGHTSDIFITLPSPDKDWKTHSVWLDVIDANPTYDVYLVNSSPILAPISQVNDTILLSTSSIITATSRATVIKTAGGGHLWLVQNNSFDDSELQSRISALEGKNHIEDVYSSGDSVYINTSDSLYGVDVGLMTLDTTITHFMGGNVEYDFTYAANTYDIINISVTNTAFGDIVSVVIPDYSTGIRAKTITLSAFNIPGSVITIDGNRLSSSRFDDADTEFSNTTGSDTTYVYYTGDTYFPQASNVYKYTAANFTGSNLWFVQSYQNESHNIAYDENGVETVNQAIDSLFNRNFIKDVSVSDDSTSVVTRDSTYRIPNSSQEFTLFKNAYAGNGGRILDTLIAAVGSAPLVVDLSSNKLQNRYTDVKIQLAAVIAGGNPSDNVFIKLPNPGGKLQRVHIYPSPLGAPASYYAISSDNISSSISTMPTDELVKYQTGFDSLVSHYVNDTVRIPYSTSTLFTRVGITLTSETSWWVDYNTSNQETINSIQDQLDGLNGTVSDFYKDQGDAVLVTSDSTYRVSLDSLNFGNRVYFSKAIGDNATGERGNPAKPFADPWSAFSASQDGDIITGLTRDTFNLITGDPQLGGSEFYALNGRIYVAAGLSKSINVEFFHGSVIKGDNTSTLASFAVDQGDNDLVIKNVKFEGNSNHPYFDAYVYGSPGEPRNFIFENVAIDSIGSSYFETYQANADLHFTEITASNEGTGFHQFYMDPDLDNLTTSIRVDKSNCVFDENYIEGGYNSTNNTVSYSINTDKENVLTIQGIEGSTINLDVNSPASGLYFYTDSCLINVNLIGTADEYDALGLDFYNLIEVSGDNNLVEGTLNGMFYAGTNYSGEALSITGANNDVTFTGEIEILNSDIYDCLFYLEDDSTNQVLVKDFMIVNWDAPIFRAATTGFSQESEFTFVNSFIETLDSTFLDAGNRTNNLNPFKLVNTTINYVGTDNVTSFLNENWTYELDGFSSNVPEFDNQTDYDNQITYISNKSLEDKLKYQDVNINGGDNVLRIGSGTPPRQIIASSRQTTQFSSTEGDVNFVAQEGTIRLQASSNEGEGIRMVNVKTANENDSIFGLLALVNGDTVMMTDPNQFTQYIIDSTDIGSKSSVHFVNGSTLFPTVYGDSTLHRIYTIATASANDVWNLDIQDPQVGTLYTIFINSTSGGGSTPYKVVFPHVPNGKYSSLVDTLVTYGNYAGGGYAAQFVYNISSLGDTAFYMVNQLVNSDFINAVVDDLGIVDADDVTYNSTTVGAYLDGLAGEASLTLDTVLYQGQDWNISKEFLSNYQIVNITLKGNSVVSADSTVITLPEADTLLRNTIIKITGLTVSINSLPVVYFEDSDVSYYFDIVSDNSLVDKIDDLVVSSTGSFISNGNGLVASNERFYPAGYDYIIVYRDELEAIEIPGIKLTEKGYSVYKRGSSPSSYNSYYNASESTTLKNVDQALDTLFLIAGQVTASVKDSVLYYTFANGNTGIYAAPQDSLYFVTQMHDALNRESIKGIDIVFQMRDTMTDPGLLVLPNLKDSVTLAFQTGKFVSVRNQWDNTASQHGVEMKVVGGEPWYKAGDSVYVDTIYQGQRVLLQERINQSFVNREISDDIDYIYSEYYTDPDNIVGYTAPTELDSLLAKVDAETDDVLDILRPVKVNGNLDLQNNDLININAIDSKIDFSSGIEFQDNLDMGSWNISNVNNMTSIGGITMAGDLDMNGFEILNLSVIGGIEFNPTVTLNTNLNMNSYDIVNGNDATFDGALSVMGGLDLQSSDITNANDITGGGLLTMDGGFSSSSGNLSLTGGGISVSDDIVTTSGNLEVQNGELTVEDNLTVNAGDVEITSGMLTVGSSIEAQDGIMVTSGDIELGSGALVTSGDIEAGSLTVDADVVAGGNLEADGGAFGSDVEIGGSITSVMSIEVSGPLTADEGEFFGGVSIGGDLDMNGNEILNAIIAPNLVTGFTDTTQVLRDSIQALKARIEALESASVVTSSRYTITNDSIDGAGVLNLYISSENQTFIFDGVTEDIVTMNVYGSQSNGTVYFYFLSDCSTTITFSSEFYNRDTYLSTGDVNISGKKIMSYKEFYDGATSEYYGK